MRCTGPWGGLRGAIGCGECHRGGHGMRRQCIPQLSYVRRRSKQRLDQPGRLLLRIHNYRRRNHSQPPAAARHRADCSADHSARRRRRACRRVAPCARHRCASPGARRCAGRLLARRSLHLGLRRCRRLDQLPQLRFGGRGGRHRRFEMRCGPALAIAAAARGLGATGRHQGGAAL